VARGAAGGAGLRAGGVVRDWNEGGGDAGALDEGTGDAGAWDEAPRDTGAEDAGAARDGARTGMAGGVRLAAGWPFPECQPSGPGALDRGRAAPLLGWPGVPGRPVRPWDGTSGPFVPLRAQPDGDRSAGSSVREGRSNGGGVRPWASFIPPLALPLAAAPVPGLAAASGAFGSASVASASPATPEAPGTAPEVPGAAAAAPARAPAVPAAPAVATCAAMPAAWAGLRRAHRAAR
jgi:hypothetical protein